MLNIQNLHFKYPNSDFSLNIDNLTLNTGEITALIGGNGCGKTTLFRLLAGVYEPLSPCFSYQGKQANDLTKLNCRIVVHNAYGGISPRLTVMQNAQFIARLYGSDSSEAAIRSLADTIGISDNLNKKATLLSAGQARKALLLRSLASNPDILLFDEPTTALDVVGIEAMLNWIKSLSEMGKTVVVSTHNLYELGMLKPNIVGLRDGRVVCNHDSKEDISTPNKARELVRTIIGGNNEC